MIVPLDKIGHNEEINLFQIFDSNIMKEMNIKNSAGNIGRVNVEVVTNGFTKILVISDSNQEDDWVAIEKQNLSQGSKFKFLNFQFFEKGKEEVG